MNQERASVSRRLVGAPPSTAIRNAELTRKRSLNANDSDETGGEEDEGAKTTEEVDEDETRNGMEEESNTQSIGKKPKRRKRRRIRLTDQGLKAKRKAERREKLMADKKKDDVNEDGEVDIEKSNLKEEKEVEKKPQPKPRPSPESLEPFQLFCDYILRKFVLKDQEGYFTHPVSEEEAPDYHEVIESPMDFLTIRDKIEENAYTNIGQFQSDIELIVNNAQIYNSPGNLFYIAAQKLAVLSRYYFSEKYIQYLIYSLPFCRTIPIEKFGLEPQKQQREKCRHMQNKEKEREKIRSLIRDTMTSKEIIDTSPKAIKNRLTNRQPNCHLAYLDNRNGAIALNVLTPTRAGEETRLKLGDLVKPLEKGTPGICTTFEPTVVKDYPISYTNPGPYASFAPQYDTTWATLSKKDSDLLFSCYGDKDNVANVFSMKQMVQNAGDYTKSIVEQMLDEITEGEHGKTMAILEEEKSTTTEKETIDPSSVDGRLMKTGKMIEDLATMQSDRLSKPPPTTLTHALLPDAEEVKLADEIVHELDRSIIGMEVRPRDVVGTEAVHQALGLDIDDFQILSEFLEV